VQFATGKQLLGATLESIPIRVFPVQESTFDQRQMASIKQMNMSVKNSLRHKLSELLFPYHTILFA
jgi:hypothetical protein